MRIDYSRILLPLIVNKIKKNIGDINMNFLLRMRYKHKYLDRDFLRVISFICKLEI